MTVGPVAAQTSFPRGDSDCTILRTAADVVAATRGFGGTSTCENDDCDRDGTVSAADVECAARCLFGVCPVPPGAPQISAIVPDSTAALTPFSVARITGVDFGDGSEPLRVTIGGVDAPIVEITEPNTILVVVPNLPPGSTEVVVIDGDIAGAPLPLTVGPPAPGGEPDTFEGTFQLLDTEIEQVLGLDLGEVFGADEAFLRAEIERLRGEIAAAVASLLADPAFTTEERAALDAAIDASDAAERLRQDIAEELPASAGEGGGAQTAVNILRKARTIRVVAGAVQAAVEAAAPVVAPVVGTAVSPVVIVAGVGTALVGGILVAANDPLTPIITGVRFRDSGGRSRRFPTANGTVEVTGARFDSLTTGLRFDFYNGLRFTSPLEVRGDGTAVARLTNRTGVCGFVNLVLTRSVADSNPVPTRVQPELLSVEPNVAFPNQNISLLTRGVTFCSGIVHFKIGTFEVGIQNLSPIPGDTFQVAAPAARPGFVEVQLQTGPLFAEETRQLEVKTAVTGIEVRCSRGDVELKLPKTTVSCFASFLPENVTVPSDLTLGWGSTNGDVLQFSSALGSHLGNSEFQAVGEGTARVIAQLSTPAGPIRGMSEDITVVDREAPFVGLFDAPRVAIEVGTSFTVDFLARDAGFITRVVLRAMGDAAVEAEQEVPCIESDCSGEFRVNLKESGGFQQRTVTLVAEAFDGSGNSRMSNTATVRVRDRDTTPPVVQIQAPLDGGRVRPGDTVQVSARLTDNGPNDSGVAIVRVEVAGAAVATGPSPPDLELEMPLGVATRIAPFTVKSAQDLANIPDKRITITVTGADGSGNMASATATVTAVSGPMISNLTPNPSVAGSAVRVIGDGFGESQGTSTITFNGVASPGASWSNTEIVATIPDEATGTVPVVVTVDGQPSNPASLTVLGTGDVRITLVWDDTNDLDLHVIDPNNEEIFYNHTSSASGGRLDVDANAGCGSTTSSPRENIFWPTGQAPYGTYTVRVVFFEACTEPAASSPFTVNAIVDGSFMTLIEGSIGSGVREATFTRSAPE